MTKADISKLQKALALIREVAASASQSTVSVVKLNHSRSFLFLAEQLENQGSRMFAAEERGEQPVVIRDMDVSEYFNSEHVEGNGK